MSLRTDLLNVLSTWHAPDPAQGELAQEFLSMVDRNEDAPWRECAPDHVTASALIVEPVSQRVALTLHPKFNMWLQMGGHCEPGDPSIRAAALREATEESGLSDLTVHPTPLRLSKHEVKCWPGGHHLDVQFLAVTSSPDDLIASEESLEVRWFAANSLPGQTDEDLRLLVAAAMKHLEGTL